MAYVVAVKIAITYALPAVFRDPSQAAVFSWTALSILTVAGLAGVWLSLQTGFPGALSERVTSRQRYLLPVLVGLGIGVLYVAFDLLSGYSAFMIALRGQPSYNIDFPANVLIYSAGAIIVEVIYRLLPIPLILFLVSRVILRGRAEVPIFWVLAVLTSAIEPLTQNLGDAAMGPVILLHGYGARLRSQLQPGSLLSKVRFPGSDPECVAFYLIWHGSRAEAAARHSTGLSAGGFACGSGRGSSPRRSPRRCPRRWRWWGS
jgi:hypothetical protein